MKVALYSQVFNKEALAPLDTLLRILEKHNIEVTIYRGMADQISPDRPQIAQYPTFADHAELLANRADGFICLGGDGTFLNALTLVRDSGIPLIGINTGRLGFLAGIDATQLEAAMEDYVHDRYQIEERTLLQLNCQPPVFEDCPWAINDLTILKRDSSSMITINTFLNGDFLNTYWADGLIVSTPTGSTGYSLSCGGPIVFPHSGNFVLTPVAPHNLGVRPVVIPDDAILSFEVKGRGDHFLLTLDSRYQPITLEHQIAVRKAPFAIKLVLFNHQSFLQTLRSKLAWGRDFRNY